MKKIINWIKESNEDMGIIYILWVVPLYILAGAILPLLIGFFIGYGILKLLA